MDADAAFFFLLLALQAIFTGALVLFVRWRHPERVGAWRLIAPAGVPVALFLFAAYARGRAATAGPIDLAHMAVAYLVLWLVGVLWATLLLRIVRR